MCCALLGSLVLLRRAGELQRGSGYGTGFGPPRCRKWRRLSPTVSAACSVPFAPCPAHRALCLLWPFGCRAKKRGKLLSFLHLALHLSVLSIQPEAHSSCRLLRSLPCTHLWASLSWFLNPHGSFIAQFLLSAADVLPVPSVCPRIATLFPLPALCARPPAQAWRPPRSSPSHRRPVVASRAPHAHIGHLAAASV